MTRTAPELILTQAILKQIEEENDDDLLSLRESLSFAPGKRPAAEPRFA
jgi:hypothetical protein